MWPGVLDNIVTIALDDEESESNQTQLEQSFDPTEVENSIKILTSKIDDLTTCNNLIVNHGTSLQRALSELDHLQSGGDTSSKIKAINERATLFRITTNAMINVSTMYNCVSPYYHTMDSLPYHTIS